MGRRKAIIGALATLSVAAVANESRAADCVLPANKVIVYEQFPDFLAGTRVGVRKWTLPAGVATGTHNNADHKMPEIKIYQGIKTKYASIFTNATAVINITMIKDHSIAGYTGTMKNITHGNVNNPHEHHANNAAAATSMRLATAARWSPTIWTPSRRPSRRSPMIRIRRSRAPG